MLSFILEHPIRAVSFVLAAMLIYNGPVKSIIEKFSPSAPSGAPVHVQPSRSFMGRIGAVLAGHFILSCISGIVGFNLIAGGLIMASVLVVKLSGGDAHMPSWVSIWAKDTAHNVKEAFDEKKQDVVEKLRDKKDEIAEKIHDKKEEVVYRIKHRGEAPANHDPTVKTPEELSKMSIEEIVADDFMQKMQKSRADAKKRNEQFERDQRAKEVEDRVQRLKGKSIWYLLTH